MDLPADVWLAVVSHLATADVVRLTGVCRLLRAVGRSLQAWVRRTIRVDDCSRWTPDVNAAYGRYVTVFEPRGVRASWQHTTTLVRLLDAGAVLRRVKLPLRQLGMAGHDERFAHVRSLGLYDIATATALAIHLKDEPQRPNVTTVTLFTGSTLQVIDAFLMDRLRNRFPRLKRLDLVGSFVPPVGPHWDAATDLTLGIYDDAGTLWRTVAYVARLMPSLARLIVWLARDATDDLIVWLAHDATNGNVDVDWDGLRQFCARNALDCDEYRALWPLRRDLSASWNVGLRSDGTAIVTQRPLQKRDGSVFLVTVADATGA
jgi:hypothetical protein